MGRIRSGRTSSIGVAGALALMVGIAAPLTLAGPGATAAFAATPHTTGTGTGSLGGMVVDGSGTPLSGICVQTFLGGGNVAGATRAVTAADGSWTISGLAVGAYDVEFSAGCGQTTSLLPVWYGGSGSAASKESASTPVSVIANQTTSSIDVSMSAAGGTITGTVTDPTGGPIADGTCVDAFLSGTEQFGLPAASTTTSGGAYTLADLATGTYDVELDPSCGHTVSTPWATGFYDSGATSAVTDVASATTVAVTAGSPTPGIDGQLASGPQLATGTASISGTVSGIDPTNATAVCVTAYIAGTTVQAGQTQKVSPSSSSYQIAGLGAGAYDLELDPSCGGSTAIPEYSLQWYEQSTTYGSATEANASAVDVTSSSAAVTGVDTTLSTASGTLTGTVSDTAGPVTGACVAVYPAGSTAELGQTTTSSGSYSVAVPDGSYDVEFTRCGDANDDAFQWYNGTASGSIAQSGAQPVSITDSVITTVDATLAAGGDITGTITQPPLGPGGFAGIEVSLYPVGGGGNPLDSYQLNSVTPPTAYDMTGLPAGQYDVELTADQSTQVTADPSASEWYATSGPALDASGATTVTVSSGTPATGVDATFGDVTGAITQPSGYADTIDVSLYPMGGSAAVASTTGTSTGTYDFLVVPSGNFDVEFVDETGALATQWYDNTAAGASTQSAATGVSVTTATPVPNIDATMAMAAAGTGTITGDVTGAGGSQAYGVCVYAYPPGSPSTADSAQSEPGGSTTDYTVTGLAAGSYDVEFDPTCGGMYAPGYPVEYYDSNAPGGTTTVAADATAVTVPGGGTGISDALPTLDPVSTSSTQVVAAPAAGDASPPTFGQSITYTATVTGVGAQPPTGTVTIWSGSTELCTTSAISGSGNTVSGSCAATNTPVGTNQTITATYGGDSYNIGSSGTTTVSVAQAATTASVQASTNDPSVGQQVTYTATVTPVPDGGTVTFDDSGTPITCTGGNQSVDTTTGQATCALSYGATGTHSITATYGGDGSFGPSSASPTVAVTVVADASSTQVTITPAGGDASPPIYGQPITYSATVSGSGGTPTGSVSFAVGTTDLCTITSLSAGSGSCSATDTPAGSGETVTATYSGDAVFGSSKGTGLVTVGQAATSVSLGTSTNSPVVGQQVTYTATVSVSAPGSGSPTGTVTFDDNGTPVTCTGGNQTVDVATGQATCAVSYPTASTTAHPMTAIYGGDTNFAASGASNTEDVTVGQAATSVSLGTSTNSPVVGQQVTLTATVSPPPDSGTVNFDDNGNPVICTGGNQTPNPLTGVATCQLAYDTASGTAHPMSAIYGGDANYGASGASNTEDVTVGQAATSVSLGTSTNSPVVGQPVTYTATVSVTSPGSGSPTGTVTFDDSGTPITCTGGVQSVYLGQATCTVTYTTPSTTAHPMTAIYGGDANYGPSGASNTEDVTVGQAATSVSLGTSTTSPVIGQPVTYTATVSVSAPGSGSPTGTVTFDDNGAPITCTGGDQTIVSGQATCIVTYTTTSGSPLPITATYGGDTRFAGSSPSAATLVKLEPASTSTSARTSVPSTDFGGSVTYSATVTGPSGAGLPTPTGTVTFTSGGTTLCTTPALAGSGNSASSSCTATDAPGGMQTVAATYSGDANYASSIGTTPLTIDIVPPPAPPGASSSSSASSVTTSGTASASSGDISALGHGVGALTVATYSGDPTTGSVTDGTGAYFDFAVGQGSAFTSLTITICNPGSGQSLDWWTGSAWKPFDTQTTSNGCLVATVTGTSTPALADLTGTPIAVSSALPPSANRYLEVGRDGGMFAFGAATYEGSLPALGVHVSDIVDMAATLTGKGYWLVGRDGGMFAFGDAPYEGSLPALGVHVSDIVSMVPTSDGRGYWLVGRDGGTFAFGDAGFVGSLPGVGVHVSDIVSMAPTPDGGGYLLVGSDGGIFTFGDARFEGSVPGVGVHVNNVVGMVETPDGNGYWLVGTDGGIFAFGDAPYEGSLPALGVHVSDIVAMAP